MPILYMTVHNPADIPCSLETTREGAPATYKLAPDERRVIAIDAERRGPYVWYQMTLVYEVTTPTDSTALHLSASEGDYEELTPE